MRVNFKGVYKISIPQPKRDDISDIKKMICFADAEVVVSSPFSDDTLEVVNRAKETQTASPFWIQTQVEKNGYTMPRRLNDSVDVFMLTGADAKEYRKLFSVKKLTNPNNLLSKTREFTRQHKIDTGMDENNLDRLIGYFCFLSEQEKRFDSFISTKNVQPMEDALNWEQVTSKIDFSSVLIS